MHHEDYDSDVATDQQYFAAYENLEVHQLMLNDEPRMNFYKSVLNEKYVKGKVVVDVGAGSGILSCWSAFAGANHVFALEGSSLAVMLPLIFLDNHIEKTVTVISSSVQALIQEGADQFIRDHPFLAETEGISIIVSEWMGFYLFHEGMLQSVLEARDFFVEVNRQLGKDTTLQLIPSSGNIFAAPIELQPLKDQSISRWKGKHNVDFSRLGTIEFEEKTESSPLVEQLPQSCLLHEGEVFWSADFNTLRCCDLDVISSEKTFNFSNSVIFKRKFEEAEEDFLCIDGFAIWFTVTFGEHTLDTSPLSEPTHWKQTTVLLPQQIRDERCVRFSSPSESLRLTLRMNVADESKRFYTINTELS